MCVCVLAVPPLLLVHTDSHSPRVLLTAHSSLSVPSIKTPTPALRASLRISYLYPFKLSSRFNSRERSVDPQEKDIGNNEGGRYSRRLLLPSPPLESSYPSSLLLLVLRVGRRLRNSFRVKDSNFFFSSDSLSLFRGVWYVLLRTHTDTLNTYFFFLPLPLPLIIVSVPSYQRTYF